MMITQTKFVITIDGLNIKNNDNMQLLAEKIEESVIDVIYGGDSIVFGAQTNAQININSVRGCDGK